MSALRFHWRLPQGGERPGASRSLQSSLRETGLPEIEPQVSFCRAAEEAGIEALLTDFGWSKPDSILLTAALGSLTTKIKFIVAYRSGLMCPTTFVQQLNTLSTLIDGRFSINVVAGHSPEEQHYYGDFLPHDERYARTEEFLAVCNAFWRDAEVNFNGAYYRIEGGKLNTPFISGDGARAPELYIAGNSEPARALTISQGSCWMMMADAPGRVASKVGAVVRAGKSIGLRMSVVTRPTRNEALDAARTIADGAVRTGFDSGKAEDRFVARSDASGMRSTFALAEEEWLAPWLWTGLVRTHGAPALAMVGSYDDVAGALMEYKAAGVTQFILSGWPKLDEMITFGREVIPRVRELEAILFNHKGTQDTEISVPSVPLW